MNEKINAWCSLLRAPGVGTKTFQALLAAFSSPEAFFNATKDELVAKLPHFSLAKLQRWQRFFNCAAPDLAWLAGGENRHILCFDDPLYPPLLREIDDPPPVLFAMGDLNYLQRPQIGIVGSRQASETAKQTCYQFARYLSEQGFLITSGLALGIDGAAHEGGLAGLGGTAAVVGTGLERVYPARHRQLAAQIINHGIIVSELPPDTPARSMQFPRRNRIISGLSLGILVVEASLHSGSLITARLALEQGREVFAIPGSIHNPLARGCHHLIKQGAKLVETASDILEELHPLLQAQMGLRPENKHPSPDSHPSLPVITGNTAPKHGHLPSKNRGEPQPLPPTTGNLAPENTLDEKSCHFLTMMGYEVCHHDDLVSHLKLTSEEVSAMLSELELEGYLLALGGGLFQRIS